MKTVEDIKAAIDALYEDANGSADEKMKRLTAIISHAEGCWNWLFNEQQEQKK